MYDGFMYVKLNIWLSDKTINTYWKCYLDGRRYPKPIKEITMDEYFLLNMKIDEDRYEYISEEYISKYDNILPINILRQKSILKEFKEFYLTYIDM